FPPTLFGGRASTAVYDDTWVWDDLNFAWSESQPANKPPKRAFHGMARNGQEVGKSLIFGGIDDSLAVTAPNSSHPCQDTWQWDGSNWTDLSPTPRTAANTPPCRAAQAMT